jgi:putative glycosyltransferase (TIGR04372 family)
MPIDPVRVNAGGGALLLMRPEIGDPGALSLDLLALFNRARAEHAGACVLAPVAPADEPLLAIAPEGIAAVVAGHGHGAWRARWWASSLARRARAALSEAAHSFWREWYRELRRHAGDERLPLDWRVRLRESARQALARSTSAPAAAGRLPRRLLRPRLPSSLHPAVEASAMSAAAAAGLDLSPPLVVFDVRRRPDTCAAAIEWLIAQGYTVIRTGPSTDPIGAPRVRDLSASPQRTRALELMALMRAAFLITDTPAMQQVAYLTNTPSLLLNARDVFAAYPLRDDSVFTLATPIDLDTGLTRSFAESLRDGYYRSRGDYGFRDNDAGQVLAAVREMHDGVTAGWRDDDNQARVREVIAAAGSVLAVQLPTVAEYGPDEGFIGDGRLVRWQAAAFDAGGRP